MILSMKPPKINPVVLLGGLITLGNLGTILHKSSRVYLFQQAQCLNYYRLHDAAVIGPSHNIEESLCKITIVQWRLSIVEGVDSLLQCLPPLVILGVSRELMERIGLRRLLILNLCCAALAVFYSITQFWLHSSWTTEAALLSFLFDLIGGGDPVRITMVCRCIADLSPPEKLTNAYNYVSGFYFVASVFGSAIGSLLLTKHVYILNGLSISCFLFAACTAASLVPVHYGRDSLSDEITESSPNPSPSDPLLPAFSSRAASPSPSSKKPPLSQILLRSWRASYASLFTLFSSPNPAFTVILLLLINGLATRIGVILPQYTSLALGWPFATVNRLLALKALISAASLFALPTLRRKYLEPRFAGKGGSIAIDLFITQISLVANTIGIIGLGFSAGVPFFIVALCVYTSGTGLADSLISFGTHTLPKGELVADFYVRTGLVSAVAALIGGPLWSAAMSYVLRSEWIPLGMPFWICAGLFGLGCAGVATLRTI